MAHRKKQATKFDRATNEMCCRINVQLRWNQHQQYTVVFVCAEKDCVSASQGIVVNERKLRRVAHKRCEATNNVERKKEQRKSKRKTNRMNFIRAMPTQDTWTFYYSIRSVRILPKTCVCVYVRIQMREILMCMRFHLNSELQEVIVIRYKKKFRRPFFIAYKSANEERNTNSEPKRTESDLMSESKGERDDIILTIKYYLRSLKRHRGACEWFW